jgi:hypothetical protein
VDSKNMAVLRVGDILMRFMGHMKWGFERIFFFI